MTVAFDAQFLWLLYCLQCLPNSFSEGRGRFDEGFEVFTEMKN